MSLNHEFKMFELRDAKVSRLLQDDSTALTYGPAKDIPGVTKLGITPKTESKELNGDSVRIDHYSRITHVEVDIESSLFSVDALPIMMGGVVEESGTSPNQKIKYRFTSDSATLPYFKIEGQWTYVNEGIGDAHVTIYKCKVSDPPSFEINDASGNFGTLKAKAIGLYARHNGEWWDLDLNETAVAIT